MFFLTDQSAPRESRSTTDSRAGFVREHGWSRSRSFFCSALCLVVALAALRAVRRRSALARAAHARFEPGTGVVTALFAGDTLLGNESRNLIERRGYTYLLSRIAGAYERREPVVVNLEAPATRAALTDKRKAINTARIPRRWTRSRGGFRRSCARQQPRP